MTSRQYQRYLQRQAEKAARRKGLREDEPTAMPWNLVKSYLKLVLMMASICGVLFSIYTHLPTLEISTRPWDSSSGPADARFEFRNPGLLTIRNVRFDCEIETNYNKQLKTDGNSTTENVIGKRGQVLGDMAPGQSVTRTCFGAAGQVSLGPHPSTIRLVATFLWPIFDRQGTVSAYFVSETDGRRWWMVPEKSPP
ncbi:hypothetical protein [Rhodopseudomonas sp. BR0G17]|uniref:hypothetical protein n=1 Tax=Rhodopseudomonas sp. BR0G17 TaxID=2269368 RepID=UPI0013DF9A2C|nr:hypothetical protein [Rhodopseudomonas sp. BR0G17]